MASSVRSAADALKRLPLGLLRAVPGLALSLSLTACAGSSIGSSFASFMPGSPAPEAPADPKELNKFAATPTCPGAEIRYGAEAINLYTNNAQPTPQTLRFQINVQRVARECDTVGDNVVARVGIAGRVVAGPKGSASKIDVPVRIVAMSGNQTVYTALKIVPVSVEAPDFGANWSIVDDSVSIPASAANGTVIYIGLEDKNKPAHEAKPKATSDATPRVVRRRPKPQAEPSAPSQSGFPDMTPAYIK